MIRFDYELFDQTSGTRLAPGFTKHIFCGRDFRPGQAAAKILAALRNVKANPAILKK